MSAINSLDILEILLKENPRAAHIFIDDKTNKYFICKSDDELIELLEGKTRERSLLPTTLVNGLLHSACHTFYPCGETIDLLIRKKLLLTDEGHEAVNSYLVEDKIILVDAWREDIMGRCDEGEKNIWINPNGQRHDDINRLCNAFYENVRIVIACLAPSEYKDYKDMTWSHYLLGPRGDFIHTVYTPQVDEALTTCDFVIGPLEDDDLVIVENEMDAKAKLEKLLADLIYDKAKWIEARDQQIEAIRDVISTME